MATSATPGYTPKAEPLAKRKAWLDLQNHYQEVRPQHLKKLFAEDPQRGERMTAEAVGIFLDYSKNRITDRTVQLLIQLAEESGLRSNIDAMFRGEKINFTEKRAVLHVALRAPRSEEHTSELQSRLHLVCRLLLEKKKNKQSLTSLSAHSADRVRCCVVS